MDLTWILQSLLGLKEEKNRKFQHGMEGLVGR